MAFWGPVSETFGLTVSQLRTSWDQAREANGSRELRYTLTDVEDLASIVSGLVDGHRQATGALEWFQGELAVVESRLSGAVFGLGDFKEELNDVLWVLRETDGSFARLERFLSDLGDSAAVG
jgi:hypothetical protein